MATTTLPVPTTRRTHVAGRRFGYLVAIAANAVAIWMVHQLLEWGWPGFLTSDFEEVLPVITASLVVSIGASVCFLIGFDRGRFKAFADLLTGAFGLLVLWRIWSVFPFDFSGYEHDWSVWIRVGLVLGFVGTAIAVIVNDVKLMRPDGEGQW